MHVATLNHYNHRGQCVLCLWDDPTASVMQFLRIDDRKCAYKGRFTHTMPFPCRVKGRFTHTINYAIPMPLPCHDHATTLPFSDSVVSFIKVPYLVHEVLLLSPSRNYLLLNCYHNLCAVNYRITHVLAPK
jgi:hypothetical protein